MSRQSTGKHINQPLRKQGASGHVESTWMQHAPNLFTVFRIVGDRRLRSRGNQLPLSVYRNQGCRCECLFIVVGFAARFFRLESACPQGSLPIGIDIPICLPARCARPLVQRYEELLVRSVVGNIEILVIHDW